MNEQTAAKTVEDMSALAGKYLTFNLADEGYGLEILKVQEIIGVQKITAIPNAPPHVVGVINLRGKVIPVVDLRVKFDMPPQEFSRKTCIIVVQVEGDEGDVIMGVLVDEVSEVLDIEAGQIEPPPSLGSRSDAQFILGMAKTESAVKILLDIDRVNLNSRELRNM